MTAMVAEDSERLLKFDRKSPVRLVGLATILAVTFILFEILWPLRWSLVALWFAIEFMFYTFYWRPRWAELNKQPVPHRPTAHNAMKAFKRTLKYFKETPELDKEMYYKGWFLGAKYEDVKRGNAEEFLAYAFWYRTLEEMTAEGRGHIPAQMVDELEATWNVKHAPGYTPGLQFMGHLWEPLKASWRPLCFYIGTETLGWFARQLLRRWGFQQDSHMSMAYFTLNMRSKAMSATRSGSSSSAISDGSVASALSGSGPSSAAAAPAVPAAAPEAARSAKSSPASIPPYAAAAAAAAVADSAAAPAAAAGMGRAKSSPFAAAGFDWAAQLAADADFLAASINAASAVHAPAVPVPQAAAAAAAAPRAPGSRSRRNSTNVSRRSSQQHQSAAATNPAPLAPWLSTHTSVMLKAMPNPLEDALEEGLGGKDMPVLFLHGVGGLPAYLEMLLQVMALGHPLIVVECTAVAMRLGDVMTADQTVEAVVGILDKLRVEKACVIGHSYGTFVAGRLARLHRKRVHSLCLIDPVCFGMFMPQLLSNFLYKAPEWKGLHHVVDYVKKAGVYMASHELHVCATFSRGFFWTDLNLWPEDLAPGSVVLLSGHDDLMNARQVQDMLQRSGHVKVHYNHELTHGEFLIKSEVKQAIMEEVRGMLARSGSAVVGLARPVLETTMTLARNVKMGVTGGIRVHTHGGSKYVEDHTNKLVRTFTGNLTAALQTVTSIRHNFDALGRSSGGGASASRNSSLGGSMPPRSRLGASRNAQSVGGAGVDGNSMSGFAAANGASVPGKAIAASSGLAQAFSLPVRRKNTREQWVKRVLGASAGGAASSSSSGNSQMQQQQGQQPEKQLPKAAATSAVGAAVGHKQHVVVAGVKGGLSRKSSREGRRSSGSGQKKVTVMTDAGVEVVAGASIPEEVSI